MSERISPQDEAAVCSEMLNSLAQHARIGGGSGVDALTYITADQCERFRAALDDARAELGVLRGELQGRDETVRNLAVALDQCDRYTYGWRFGLASTMIDKIRLTARSALESIGINAAARGVIGEEPNGETD